MDIYRFFHPHHNPRLVNTALRYTELSELLQAAVELRKALERAQQRTSRQAIPPILSEHFTDIIKAERFIEDSGDELQRLASERSSSSGWQAWTKSVQTGISTK
jgi:hypothetical protein